MSFRPMLRPVQGFKTFRVLRREGEVTASGRPHTSKLTPQGEFDGIISEADPKEIEQFKQRGTPITHTIVQRGTKNRGMADDILELGEGDAVRRFRVKGEPKDPGELGFFLVYRVEERDDLE